MIDYMITPVVVFFPNDGIYLGTEHELESTVTTIPLEAAAIGG